VANWFEDLDKWAEDSGLKTKLQYFNQGALILGPGVGLMNAFTSGRTTKALEGLPDFFGVPIGKGIKLANIAVKASFPEYQPTLTTKQVKAQEKAQNAAIAAAAKKQKAALAALKKKQAAAAKQLAKKGVTVWYG